MSGRYSDREGGVSMNLTTVEQATLFQFILENGLPSWARDDATIAFARLMNKPTAWAKKAYADAAKTGYIERKK